MPSPTERPPTTPDWVREIKHDGYRLMARRDPIGIRLLTRNGHDWLPPTVPTAKLKCSENTACWTFLPAEIDPRLMRRRPVLEALAGETSPNQPTQGRYDARFP